MRNPTDRLRAYAVAAALACAAPAQAANWVQMYPGDSWIWLDRDSIYTQDGITYYTTAHSAEAGVPPNVAGTWGGVEAKPDRAINCATGEVYSYTIVNEDAYFADESFTVEPVYGWVNETGEWGSDQIARIRATICGS